MKIQETVLSLVENLQGFDKLTMSPIIAKENSIGFTIYASLENQQLAEGFRTAAESALESQFPERKILLSISNNPTQTKNKIPGIGKIITVSSGKGGVGKSTVTAALAKLLSEQGYKVGIVDADIHGPSTPRILNIQGSEPEFSRGKILPITTCNVKVMSIGFLIDEHEGALAWRGPMLSKAVKQLFSDVAWGELDYLIVDTPPGTGDIHITILSNYQIDGTFIVTIPAAVSFDAMLRSIDLYNKFGVDIYAIIENMSYYYDENSKQKIPLFGDSLEGKVSAGQRLIGPISLIPGLARVKFAEITKYMKLDIADIGI